MGTEARIVDLSDQQLRAREGVKWAVAAPDVLPAWVAEMDFALAEPVARALHVALDRGAVGYGAPDRLNGVPEALSTFAKTRWDWSIDPGRVVLVGDVMGGVEVVLRTLCEPAPVVVPTPAYTPFLDVVPHTGRELVPVPLAPDDDHATLDLDAIDRALTAGARTLLLCNPHNPWGRAFTRAELDDLLAVVIRHGARVISDEIHAPLVLEGAGHVPFLTLDGAAELTTTVISAAKTWDIPGLKSAQVITGTEADRRTLRALPLVANHGSGPLGIVAARAAYLEGGPWLDALLVRLGDNRALFEALVSEQLPAARMRPLEATYLAWLDARAYGLGNPAKVALERGRVLVNEGRTFGPGGEGHVRVNLATSPERVAEIVHRLALAWER
jgi:cystathionine beta-lyase